MSETVHYKGKLTPVPICCNGGLEETAKGLFGPGDKPLPDYYNNYLEWLEEDPKSYIVTKDAIFKVDYTSFEPEDDIMIASRNDDHSIDFEIKYYNGGCSFHEAIENSIKKLDK